MNKTSRSGIGIAWLALTGAAAMGGCNAPYKNGNGSDDSGSIKRDMSDRPDGGVDPLLACPGAFTPGPAPAKFSPTMGGSFVHALDLEGALVQRDGKPFADQTDTSSVLVVDLDHDGLADFVYNHLRSGSWAVMQKPAGTFTNAGLLPPPNAQDGSPGNCMLAADFDGDGFPDLYCTAPSGRVIWGAAHAIDWTVVTSTLGEREAMAATMWDVDEDGLLDIVSSPWGAPKQLLRNLGNRSFESTGALWGINAPGNTWAIAFIDFDGDGRADVWEANDGDGKQNYAYLSTGPGTDGEPQFKRAYPMSAACDVRGFFSFGDLNPMGLATGDLNGDGVPEIFVSTASDADPVLTRQADGSWLDARRSLSFAPAWTTTGLFQVMWSPLLWDADHDGLLDILVPAGDDIGFHTMPGPARGSSHVTFYRGKPGAQFDDVHASLGFDTDGHFMNVNAADYDGDGDLDLLIGGFNQAAHVWENRLSDGGNHVLLTLRGHTSNPAGMGARVEVTAGALKRTYAVGDHWGPRMQSDPILDVALGASPQIDELRIHWPSGYDQLLRGVPAGGHRVVDEPALVTIAPAARHVSANGSATVTFTIRPASPDGTPRTDALVELDAPWHTVRWTGPALKQPDGSWVRTLTAPAAPGSAVIRVTIDGKALGVRPRVWFD